MDVNAIANRDALVRRLEEVRRRTLWLLGHVSDEYLKVRVHNFYSPIGWHFGHVGRTEEYWICRGLGVPPLDDRLSFLFADLPDNPKDNRVNLPSREQIIEYLERTRAFSLSAIERDEPDNDILRDHYAFHFAIQHECQHQETIVEMLQLITKDCQQPTANRQPPTDLLSPLQPRDPFTEQVEISGGAFCMGSDDPNAYDNEKPAHTMKIAPFQMDRTPVTAGQWRAFMLEDGYARPELWTPEGWTWRTEQNVHMPEYWIREDDRFGFCSPIGVRPINPDEPASCLSWFEADAYARWLGKRMPTEAEWEFGASTSPPPIPHGSSRTYPWGDAKPGRSHASFSLNGWSPDPVGMHPDGASGWGLLDMAGGVWEWTNSKFSPYPGFQAYPYEGYSKDHMDGRHYVCRGGSWASSAEVLRCSFRNWYVPTYRQGFLGLRCAR